MRPFTAKLVLASRPSRRQTPFRGRPAGVLAVALIAATSALLFTPGAAMADEADAVGEAPPSAALPVAGVPAESAVPAPVAEGPVADAPVEAPAALPPETPEAPVAVVPAPGPEVAEPAPEPELDPAPEAAPPPSDPGLAPPEAAAAPEAVPPPVAPPVASPLVAPVEDPVRDAARPTRARSAGDEATVRDAGQDPRATCFRRPGTPDCAAAACDAVFRPTIDPDACRDAVTSNVCFSAPLSRACADYRASIHDSRLCTPGSDRVACDEVLAIATAVCPSIPIVADDDPLCGGGGGSQEPTLDGPGGGPTAPVADAPADGSLGVAASDPVEVAAVGIADPGASGNRGELTPAGEPRRSDRRPQRLAETGFEPLPVALLGLLLLLAGAAVRRRAAVV